MRFVITLYLLVASLSVLAQEYALVNNETDKTTTLYRKANESLTKGNTKLALVMFDEVVEVFENEGRAEELPENYMGMALSLAFTGHYSESIRYHRKALRAHRKYKCGEPAYEIKINLGLVYQLAGKKRKAERFLRS